MRADSLTVLAGVGGLVWPLAATLAVVAVRDRRRAQRRRRRLNERLHELRRPLQALVLAADPAPSGAPDSLALALAALRDLEREVNGEPPALNRRPVEARLLAIAAVERWYVRAAAEGRALKLRWRAGSARIAADPVRVAQGLDNLIGNALEHGRGSIALEGALRGSRLELAVRNAGLRSPPERRRAGGDHSHGHGLRVTRAIAQRHGGALRLRAGERGALAVLELPLAAPREGRGADPHRV